MFNHYNMAVDGVTPSYSKRNLALLGLTNDISIEIIVTPVINSFGGAAGFIPVASQEESKYEITVRIMHKDKVWYSTKLFNILNYDAFIIITTKFIRIKSIVESIKIKFLSLIKNRNDVK